MQMQPLTLSEIKRQEGRYYTRGNPFLLKPFHDWAESIALKNKKVLEPFAGANNIIRALQQSGYAGSYSSFDIVPGDITVQYADTIKDFPKNFDVCITNPPWLAKNSAKRRGLWYPESNYDDLYKHCLDLCLQNCKYVGALVPATFLSSELFRGTLDTIIFLHDESMFNDTENPVSLALFKEGSTNVKVYFDGSFVGRLSELEKKLPTPQDMSFDISFNDPQGVLGFIAFDQTSGPTIRFCDAKEIADYPIKHTSRMITRIGGDFDNLGNLIDALNTQIEYFRKETRDVFLTPFKGLRKDGVYRRRMDYRLARDFIAAYA